jgi:hypothetical protein
MGAYSHRKAMHVNVSRKVVMVVIAWLVWMVGRLEWLFYIWAAL